MALDPSWFWLAGIFFSGALLGFVAGGEWRHRLWTKNDRYNSENTISFLKQHNALLHEHVKTLQKHSNLLTERAKLV